MPRSLPPAGPFNVLSSQTRRRLARSLPGMLLLAAPLAALAQDNAQDEPLNTMVIMGTALKIETPAVETPRATSVVASEELEERAVNDFDETFRYRSGVISAPYGDDNKADWFVLRGFDAGDAIYQDGLRMFREGGYFWWLTEPFGQERVELLKGPASILYGEAPPGGVINSISKRPTEEARGLFELEAGSDDHHQVGIDTSGPLAGTDDVRYRVVGLFREGDNEIDGTDNERVYFAPSLSVDLTEDTRITFLASYMKDHGVSTNGFFLPYGSLNDTPFGKVDPQTNLGEPDYDRREHKQVSLGYEFEHDFDDTWTFQQNLRYSELELLLRGVYASYMADERHAVRGLTYRDGEYDALTVDNRLVGKWFTANTENTLLLGVDYQDFDLSYQNGDDFNFGEPFDIFDPEYGNYTPVDASGPEHHYEQGKEQLGLYVQDQLRLYDRWVLLAGMRHDSVDVTNRSGTGDDSSYDDDQMSFSGGVMYLGDYGISPYLSYSESFNPQIGYDPDGNAYVPSEGEQWEAGVKYAPDWLDGYVTAAAFDLKETNTLYVSGESSNRQGGERHSQGFELEGVGYLTDQLQVKAAYTYTDTTIESPVLDEVRAGGIPRHQASLWLDYGFEGGALNGLDIGGGVRYVGESVDSPLYSDAEVSSYTVYDAMAQYAINDQWTAQLNVKNLTDKEYISNCNYWCYYGESRSVVGSLKYHW
ncbi:TonB-dependent siderophore receptor [Halomonas shantousis]